MNVLKDNDFFGVFAVDTKVHEVVPRVDSRSDNRFSSEFWDRFIGWWHLYLHLAGGRCARLT